MATAVDYLRPPEESLTVMHPEIDTSVDVNNRPPVRLVYYCVEYSPAEHDIANRIYNEVLKDPDYSFPQWWLEGDTLRFVHEFNFNEAEIVKVMQDSNFLASQGSFAVAHQLGPFHNHRQNDVFAR